MDSKNKYLMTEKDVAESFGLSASTLSRWRCYGGGPPFVKLGRSKNAMVRYRPEDVKAWLDGLSSARIEWSALIDCLKTWAVESESDGKKPTMIRRSEVPEELIGGVRVIGRISYSYESRSIQFCRLRISNQNIEITCETNDANDTNEFEGQGVETIEQARIFWDWLMG